MNSKRLTPTHKRFLIFYLVFACLLFGAYVPIYSYVHEITYDNVCKQARSVLDGGVTSLVASANAITNPYRTTVQDSRFRTLKYEEELSMASLTLLHDLQAQLRNSLSSAELAADAGILRSADFAITRNRSFYSDVYYTFYPDFISCDSLTFDEWMQQLRTGGSSGRWLTEHHYQSADYQSGYNALTYACIWYNSPLAPLSVYFGTLQTDPLVARLADEEALETGSLRIMDQDGTVLLSRGTLSEELEIITQTAPQIGLTVEVGLHRNYLYQQLLPLERMITLSLLLFVAVAIVLVVYFSRRSAEPMVRLLRSIDPTQPVDRDEPARRLFWDTFQQDYETVYSSIRSMNRQMRSNAEVIQEQTQRLRDYLFERALQNALYTQKDRYDFQQLFADFPDVFHLALLRCDLEDQSTDEAVQVRSAILQAANAQLPELYLSHATGSGMILLVLRQENAAGLEALRQSIRSELGMDSRIYLTQAFSGASQLSLAYEQALSLMWVPSDADVVVFSITDGAAPIDHNAMPLSYAALLEMYEALSTGDDGLARVILSDCAATLLSHPDQLMVARHTHSLISQMLAQLKMEYPVALFSVIIPSFNAQDLTGLFGQELPECFQRISRSLRENQTPENDLSVQVCMFISDSLFSPDMCVTYVADHFGIAKNTLQKIIKAATGTTFSAYISEQRLERAYRLLAESGVSVNQVSEMCGFTSTNSFYKAFRRRYGIAPSAVAGAGEEEQENI